MKTMSATIMSLALLVCPTVADETLQSTMSGTVTLQVVPNTTPDVQAQPQSSETMTLRIVRPPQQVNTDEDDIEYKLQVCGKRWNQKLSDFEKSKKVAEQKRTRIPDRDILTRVSYRQCMYWCLDELQPPCPGGLPAKK
jgi:hypothetical protein